MENLPLYAIITEQYRGVDDFRFRNDIDALIDVIKPTEHKVQMVTLESANLYFIKWKKIHSEAVLLVLYDNNDVAEIMDQVDDILKGWYILGANSESQKLLLSKIQMKNMFKKFSIPTAEWICTKGDLCKKIMEDQSKHWIVKSECGNSAIGLTDKSRVNEINQACVNWDSMDALGLGTFAEEFIDGQEVTVIFWITRKSVCI